MDKLTSLSIFYPAYNEEKNVEDIINKALEMGPKVAEDFEVILIDDGSGDKTGEIADRMADENPGKVKVVHHQPNRGYGGALKSGFFAASKEYIFYTDADQQFDLEEIKLLLPYVTEYDIVVGFRINRQDPLMRLFAAWFYNKMMSFLYGLKIRDVDCAFKLVKKKIFDEMSLKSETGFIETEYISKAQRQGFKIKEVGVHHFPRKKGQTSYEIGERNKIFAFVKPKMVVDIFKEMKKLWGEMR